jgi:hypothetical protein
MGDFPAERIAVMGFGRVSTLAGVSFTFMRYCTFYLAKLVDERIDRRLLKSAMLKILLNPILNSIAVLVAFVDTRLAIALYIILPLMFFIPGKLERYVHSGGGRIAIVSLTAERKHECLARRIRGEVRKGLKSGRARSRAQNY